MTMPMNDEEFLDNVSTVIDAGGAITDEYARLLTRLSDFHGLESASLTLLKQAVAGKVPMTRVAELRSLSYAELATPVEQATVRNAVRAEIIRLLRAEYAKTAEENYETFADRFNDTASQLTDAHSTAPVTADPGSLINAPEDVRTAWSDGQRLVLELDALTDLLATAAALAGHSVRSKGARVGLTVIGEGLHRRRLWEAYDEGWAAVLTLGAELHAPKLNQFKPLAEPQPLETRYERGNMGMRSVEWDPEDEHTPEEEAKYFTLT